MTLRPVIGDHMQFADILLAVIVRLYFTVMDSRPNSLFRSCDSNNTPYPTPPPAKVIINTSCRHPTPPPVSYPGTRMGDCIADSNKSLRNRCRTGLCILASRFHGEQSSTSMRICVPPELSISEHVRLLQWTGAALSCLFPVLRDK